MPQSAVILHISSGDVRLSSALKGNAITVSPFASTLNLIVSRLIMARFSASCIVMTAFPLKDFSERFLIVAGIVALSPRRRKRGMLGCIINSLTTVAVVSASTIFISFVCARTLTFQRVRLSGVVNAMVRFPFSSERSEGAKKAVSAKFSRTAISFVSSEVSAEASEVETMVSPKSFFRAGASAVACFAI